MIEIYISIAQRNGNGEGGNAQGNGVPKETRCHWERSTLLDFNTSLLSVYKLYKNDIRDVCSNANNNQQSFGFFIEREVRDILRKGIEGGQVLLAGLFGIHER